MFDRGEIPLHDDYGGVEYWKVKEKIVFIDSFMSKKVSF